jgi:hypothetical protein
MQQITDDLQSRGLGDYAKTAGKIRQRMGSAQLNPQTTGYLRSFSTGGTRGMGMSLGDSGAVDDLVGYGCNLSNRAQESMTEAFTGDSSMVADTPAVPPINVQVGMPLIDPIAPGAYTMSPDPGAPPLSWSSGPPVANPLLIVPSAEPVAAPAVTPPQTSEPPKVKRGLKQKRTGSKW